MMENTPAKTAPGAKWKRPLRYAAFVVTALLAVVALGVDSLGQQDFARPADAIVVLGARVEPGGTPGDSLRARTLQAVHLYRKGLAPAILFTGGVGDHPPSESQAACTLAQSQGIPAEACALEEHSTSTWENATYAAAICRERAWTRVIVVSDPYHLCRATRNFRKVGLQVYPSPAKECARNRTFLSRAEWAFRDTLLLLRDFLLGRA